MQREVHDQLPLPLPMAIARPVLIIPPSTSHGQISTQRNEWTSSSLRDHNRDTVLTHTSQFPEALSTLLEVYCGNEQLLIAVLRCIAPEVRSCLPALDVTQTADSGSHRWPSMLIDRERVDAEIVRQRQSSRGLSEVDQPAMRSGIFAGRVHPARQNQSPANHGRVA